MEEILRIKEISKMDNGKSLNRVEFTDSDGNTTICEYETDEVDIIRIMREFYYGDHISDADFVSDWYISQQQDIVIVQAIGLYVQKIINDGVTYTDIYNLIVAADRPINLKIDVSLNLDDEGILHVETGGRGNSKRP